MNLILENKTLGVAVKVVNAANRVGYVLTHLDVDSGRVIETRYFSSLFAAEDYARKCVSDVVPAGTSILV
jgi:hypothetical protein